MGPPPGLGEKKKILIIFFFCSFFDAGGVIFFFSLGKKGWGSQCGGVPRCGPQNVAEAEGARRGPLFLYKNFRFRGRGQGGERFKNKKMGAFLF